MTDGNAFFPELLKDISAARHHIHIDIYIFEDDALGNLIADALRDKARQGVKVRIVYDDVGCWRVSHCFFESMREEGIEVAPYLPVRFPSFTSRANYRNHRKLIVIDGKVGYVGGMNIALRYVKWRDTMLRVTGGAVYALQRAFLVDWYFVDRTLITDRSYYPALSHDDGLGGNNCICQLVTSGPTSAFPEIMQGYVRVIMGARRYVYIETPYFLPNEPVLFALKTAALAGVDVRLLCPRDSDARFTEWASRSYLREVAQAGVKVYLYEPAFLHSKVMVSDDSLCICGSVNIDFRSFENNFESSLFIYDEGTALRLKKVIQDDLRHAVSLEDVHEWMSPSWRARLCESFTRLFSPLL
jgi:cardiolipin synthase